MRASSIAVVGALAIIGCGPTIPPPTTQYTAAQSEVARAQQIGAASVPTAAPHLQAAQANLDQANERINGQYKDYERATSLVDRSRAEASLAFSLTREAQMKQGAAEAHAKLESMPPQGMAIGPQPAPEKKAPAAQPKKQPTKPQAAPAKPKAEPAKPKTEPAKPDNQPVTPDTKPVEPQGEPQQMP
jgi:hypothetical protein